MRQVTLYDATETQTEQIAMACHDANRVYCQANDDYSQVHWDAAPEWQRQSAIKGVTGVLLFGNSPEQSHESWMAQKRADGWVYGLTKDPEAKTHPCMVPYAQLSPEQQRKDHLFCDVCLAMARALDLPEIKPPVSP